MAKKNIIAMILAGGQGSRLKPLTEKIAKPAVPFGGKYRIIDFPLSNCTNSGIDTVGVLTQYEPFILNKHIGMGAPWDLDRKNGGATVLQPYTNMEGGDWYTGTANAIYQNINYIDSYDPEYVLILSGDHIYKMDYSKMFSFHEEMGAEATIAVIEVPGDEASRFGIMNTNPDYSIYEFEEKPANPKSNLASMGIYIFKWDLLKKYLQEDQEDPESSNDFGKNIIPKMLEADKKLFAYPFKGYWKDVGTIKSLWEANMDLLDSENELNIFDRDWRIYSPQEAYPPHFIGPDAKIDNSMIVEGCEIEGEVVNSVIFAGVKIGKNTKVINSVIMENSQLEENVIINKAILGSNVTVRDHTVIGDGKEVAVIEDYRVVNGNKILK
ncbi:glucose-1-phosphate adenylyltransferase [Propionigenium maris DSM 9537]|uniref:Glucose-1-phosphate adenylyltransferase n=1 Tax=Propionigenium maris DSM 9537 TaxID=1123000 RepID=A0A9W6GMH5_9FUSO|nr:glucose-1-phosphate adenylyltransferase [Propionigenium maris]GLI57178.1 glucose-1-phosphate adenylyltransferase [Propionigenium maris DSM 9537]